MSRYISEHGTVVEQVSVARERVWKLMRRHLEPKGMPLEVLGALDVFGIVEDFFGSRPRTAAWWSRRPTTTVKPDRWMVDYVVDLICGDGLWAIFDGYPDIAVSWRHRADALVAYRAQIPDREVEVDRTLGTLIEPSRSVGFIDSGVRGRSLTLARSAALAWITSGDSDERPSV